MNDGTRDDNPAVATDEAVAASPAPAAGSRRPQALVRRQSSRRRFIRSAFLIGGVLGLAMLGYVPVAGAQRSRLRPPGALEEADFLSSCIKCGQCVQVCPVAAIRLDDIDSGFGIGVPLIDARAQACDFSCDAVQCILACPTGSLTYRKPASLATRPGMSLARAPLLKAKAKDAEPTLNLPERMGVARLSRPESCLAVLGKGFRGQARGAGFRGRLRYVERDRWRPVAVRDHPYERDLCNLCVSECPIGDAITMLATVAADGSRQHRPQVLEQCVGCGVCEMICPVDPAAIVIDARQPWES